MWCVKRSIRKIIFITGCNEYNLISSIQRQQSCSPFQLFPSVLYYVLYYDAKGERTLTVEFALLFKFRNVSINLRESILFFFFIERKKRGNRIRNTTARSNDPFGERESVSLARRNLSNFPSPPFSSSKTFVDEKETKTGRKRWRGKKKKKKMGRGKEGRTCIVASTDRSKSAASDGGGTWRRSTK